MKLIGVYQPGDSWLHWAPAGAKILVLILVVTVIVVADDLWFLGAGLLGVLGLFLSARLGLMALVRGLRPLFLFLVVLALFQGVLSGWDVAARVSLQLAIMVLLGVLLSMTTQVSAMLVLFERVLTPFRFLGVDPNRSALVLALAMRAIPMAAHAWQRSREAYLARGLRGRPHRLVIPVLVSLIRSAEAMGEAMVARGVD